MMLDCFEIQNKIVKDGFAIIESIFSDEDVESIVSAISGLHEDSFFAKKSNDLFAIRRFLQAVPETSQTIFNNKLLELITNIFGSDFFVVKSIYFDKPELSNWFVAYHQDLTISVSQKEPIEGFLNWTVKNELCAVQPPVEVLENNFTIRIHLDDTDENNGALKVIPGSHRWGIIRPDAIDKQEGNETICNVGKGGIMIMKPLLMHASGKTKNNLRRRVVHLEFSSTSLPLPLQWAEFSRLSYESTSLPG